MPSARRLPLLLLALLLIGLGLAACESGTPEADDPPEGDDGAASTQTTDPPEQMPDWINRVEPVPGNQVTGEAAVVADVNFEPANRVVRLIVDGVDVTAVATDPADINASVDKSAAVAIPDRLVYDVDELETPPVNLGPGLHVATVRLLHYPEGFEAGDFEIEGSFTWTFEIL